MSPFQETKKRENANKIINIFPFMEVYIKVSNTYIVRYNKMVVPGGIEPPTRGFSVLCSTD